MSETTDRHEKRGAKKHRGVYEHPKGSDVYWVVYFDEHGRRRDRADRRSNNRALQSG